MRIYAAGASVGTRGFVLFTDGVCTGNRLGIGFEHSGPVAHVLFKITGQADGTDCGTIPATRTFININVTGFLV